MFLFIKNLFDAFVSSYLGGLIILLTGLYLIKKKKKGPITDSDRMYYKNFDIKYWGTAIIFVICGLIIIIGKIIGKI